MRVIMGIGLGLMAAWGFAGEDTPRTVDMLAEGWKFWKAPAGECRTETGGREQTGFDDTSWEPVTVPHDWAIGQPFDMNIDRQVVQVMADGEKQPQLRTGRTGALPAYGAGWYRLRLAIPEADRGRSLSVEFDGAMSNAKIYLNGRYVGEWPYGYSSFRFDVTHFVAFGATNVLAVSLDNKEESSRWYSGAGLYRHVRLVKTDPVHVAHWGTFVTTPVAESGKGVVDIVTRVNNESGEPRQVELLTEIVACAAPSKVLATARTGLSVAGSAACKQTLTLEGPGLWSPESPVLYKAISKVYAGAVLRDVYETPFGFRTLRFDKDQGFFLNGVRTPIKGVCNHHDLGPLGAAVCRRATERQLELLKEMGCNAIRTSHNPPSPELLELCDTMGFLVMDEAFDEWKIGKNRNGYSTLFDQWAEKDLVAMLRRDRNHPSVIIWSIGNEVLELNSMEPKGREIARLLTAICKREDPTRPVISGFNNAKGAIKNGIAEEVDLFGINYPRIGDMSYGKYHAEKPDYCLLGSETASTVSSRGVYKFPAKENKAPWYLEDYQVSGYDMEGPSWFSTPDHEFAMQEDCPAVAGEFVWTGFDYLGEPTPYNEGTPSRSSYFGIIDLAGLKKDRFYLYQSHWTTAPMVHVLPHWDWPDRLNQAVPVMCYTTLPKAELFVNGKSKGVRARNKSEVFGRYRLIWEDVVYEPGEIRVEALDEVGKVVLSQTSKTPGAPQQVRLTPDRAVLRADGRDLSFVTLEVLDREGNPCPRAAILQFFEVSGPGRLRALCNGDATDHTPFSSNYMKTFSGKLVAVVETTGEEGEITIRASGSKLRPAEAVLQSTR